MNDAKQALERLIVVAQGHSGQSHHLRRLLLGLYNSYGWPFELNRLRTLDTDLARDALSVIAEATHAPREIHEWIPSGDAVFQDFWIRESSDHDRGGEQ